jgi:hypothetical protein
MIFAENLGEMLNDAQFYRYLNFISENNTIQYIPLLTINYIQLYIGSVYPCHAPVDI